MSKKNIFIISGITAVISVILPFIVANEKDSLLDQISVSLSILGASMSLIALYITIILYQKFGLESKFIERKTDKVLELVDLLKGKVFLIQNDKCKYFLRFNLDNMDFLEKEDFYIYMKDMIILINHEDYENGTTEILNLRNSYWLPTEIRDKLSFIYWCSEENIEKENSSKYARLSFGLKKEKINDWSIPCPHITVEEFIKQKNELSQEIIKWLNKHCDIKLDLRMNEKNQININ